MSEQFVGEIRIVGFSFAPVDWAFCDGQLMSISQNTALFAILGTTYGGNGTTTFGLPNLQARAPVHFGQLQGGSLYTEGELSGVPTVTLTQNQMAGHNHTAEGQLGNGVANQLAPAGHTWGGTVSRPYAATSNGQMSPQALGATGGSQPHNNLPPYLVLNFIIALFGVFPSRN